jgi:hypothetical protein
MCGHHLNINTGEVRRGDTHAVNCYMMMWKYSSTVVVDLYVFCDCGVFVYSVFVFLL